jgi:molybdopterin synthase catalytic subunit
MTQALSHVAIVEYPLDVAALIARVKSSSAGAIDVFIGTVRDKNLRRSVTGIEYSAYREMAEREIGTIVGEAQLLFPGTALAVEHRVGSLAVGEASVIIASANARRGPAMESVRFVIEQLKRRAPIWKKELYVDGTREWVHAGTGKSESETGVYSLDSRPQSGSEKAGR